jgi:imidazolonepropionase-like amidohydrolase
MFPLEKTSSQVAITHVSLITMEADHVLHGQTVLVEGGRISAVEPDEEVEIPGHAALIDGSGAFLMPGLANMHAHLIEYDPDPRHLVLYLAGGITTVRALNTRKEIFNWKENVAQGIWLGPRIFHSGPAVVGFPDEYRLLALGLKLAIFLAAVLLGMLIFALLMGTLALFSSPETARETALRWALPWLVLSLGAALLIVWKKLIPLTPLAARFLPQAAFVETPRQARAEVEKQVRAGVDFIKPYDYLDRETYFATLAAAREQGLYTAGHIPEDPQFISVEDALDQGLNEIAHVDEMTHEFLIGFEAGQEENHAWDIDMARIEEIAATVARHQAAVTATLVTNETVLLGLEDADALFQKPAYNVVKAEKIAAWRKKGRLINWQAQKAYRRQKLRPLWMQLTRALHDHGVPLLLGTDSSVEGIVPGFSEHQELALLVEAGLSPYEALAAGTRDPALIARRMQVDDRWGTIAVGNHADLILLEENPLQDINNTTSILGVMVRGRWLPKEILDRYVASYLGNSDAP